ncbi:MAG TPA: hypothetical protein VGB42_09860 [Candidatus Thermoplasmatota archaeon]
MQPLGTHERPTLLDTILEDDIYDLSAVPLAWPPPGACPHEGPRRPHRETVGVVGGRERALGSGAFVEWLARGVRQGG